VNKYLVIGADLSDCNAMGTKRRSASRRRLEPSRAPLNPERLRHQLEQARLDLRALFRALDQLGLAQNLPKELKQLMNLDADFAEALWVLNQPPARFDMRAMIRDTTTSLRRLPEAPQHFLHSFDENTRHLLTQQINLVRSMLAPTDAYADIPA
jgi:hypothetical protein